MVDYGKLTIAVTDDFEVRAGRGSDNPLFNLFEQCLADGKPRAISGLSVKDGSAGELGKDAKLSEYLRVYRDATSAAQKLKRVNDGKGTIQASVKKDVIAGEHGTEGIVRIKANWVEQFKNAENGEVPTEPTATPEAPAAEPAPAGRRRGASS